MIPISETGIEALYATAHWLLAQSRHADAATLFRVMALAAPADERGWLGLGASHEGIGQLAIASELYAIATQVVETPIRANIARGRVLRSLGDADGATGAFDAALDLANESGDEPLAALALREKVTS